MIKEAIAQALDGRDLTQKQAYEVMSEIMKGQATPSQIAGYLIALRTKGETVDEIAGSALAMRDAATPVTIHARRVVDTCGTGGDGQRGLNVSTAAAFVAAGAGLTVAKHGNRSVSSKCGSADVLELLGVRIDPPTAGVEACLDRAGIGFLFAPNFHPAMKHAMPTRRELGVRTIFNILGPLTNPAKAQVQIIGVYQPELTGTVAKVLAKTGHLAGLAVHSNGWDEITLDGATKVAEMFKGKVRSYQWTHKDFGLPKVPAKHLKCPEAAQTAALISGILGGQTHPARHVVVANAAALIWIAERAFNNGKMALKEAVKKAEASIDSGQALAKLKALADVSHELS